jgi:hypothetical protein
MRSVSGRKDCSASCFTRHESGCEHAMIDSTKRIKIEHARNSKSEPPYPPRGRALAVRPESGLLFSSTKECLAFMCQFAGFFLVRVIKPSNNFGARGKIRFEIFCDVLHLDEHCAGSFPMSGQVRSINRRP